VPNQIVTTICFSCCKLLALGKYRLFELTIHQAGVFTVDPRSAASTFYNDMSIGQADYWSSQLLPQSLGIFWSRTTYAAWRWIPSTYVLCGNDQAMPLPYAKIVLNAARTSMPNMIDRVEKCEIAGHFVMLSQPEWTANMLRRAAGECL
jgi:hypothetical protein